MNSDDEDPPEWYKLLESFRERLNAVAQNNPRVCSFCGAEQGETLFSNAIRTAHICDNCVISLAVKVNELDLLQSLENDATRH